MTDAEARDNIAFDYYVEEAALNMSDRFGAPPSCFIYDGTYRKSVRAEWDALSVHDREMWWLRASKEMAK